jgi:hypothetical protein
VEGWTGHLGHAPANQRTQEKVIAVRPNIARRLLLAAAVAALVIPAGVAVATPPKA